MVKSFIKIAWRNITRNPFYSLVNIAGLSVGIAFTLLIGAYIWGELQVNSGIKNKDRQYIIRSKWKDPNQGYDLASFGQLAKALKENYPHLVANYYRFDGVSVNVSRGDKSFREGAQIGDSTFLSMYGFRLEEGNPATALTEPFSVVITSDLAKKYFGNKEALGQLLTIESFSGTKHDFQVTGVLRSFERNTITHLTDDYPGQVFIPEKNLEFFGRNMDWSNRSIASYIELQPGVAAKDLDKPMQALVQKNAGAQIAAAMTPYLTTVSNYYFTSNNGLVNKMIYALSAIALFILLMAIINFVNMAVSRSASRMREIGVRKVLGSLKKQLIGQFLAESTVLVFFAMLVAIGIYLLTRNLFSDMIGKQIPSLSGFPVYFIAFPIVMVVVTGLLAGIYPAFVLSSMRSVDSLKGRLSAAKENIVLRKGLIAFQFGTAVIVFTGAIVIARQISLFFSKDLGYDKEYVIAAQVPRDWSAAGVTRMENIRSQLAALPQVQQVTLSFEIPNGNNIGFSQLYKAGTDSSAAPTSQLMNTDEYYAATYGIPMAAGTFFIDKGVYSDPGRIVINEAQAKVLGWAAPQDAIGGQVRLPGDPKIYTIAGVTRDFRLGSMQQAIQPIAFLHVTNTPVYRFLSVKLKPGNMEASINGVQKKWSALMPGAPFEYKFIDDTLKNMYKTEIQLKQASVIATILSIIIVLLGVLGVVAINIQKRTREIGIRKVLGASVPSIISLFLKEFMVVMLMAATVACPVAWYLMKGWLNDYAHRIGLTAAPFITSVAGLTAVTILLIALQTVKAGNRNPVSALRNE